MGESEWKWKWDRRREKEKFRESADSTGKLSISTAQSAL
jgi:hypothetical protein